MKKMSRMSVIKLSLVVIVVFVLTILVVNTASYELPEPPHVELTKTSVNPTTSEKLFHDFYAVFDERVSHSHDYLFGYINYENGQFFYLEESMVRFPNESLYIEVQPGFEGMTTDTRITYEPGNIMKMQKFSHYFVFRFADQINKPIFFFFQPDQHYYPANSPRLQDCLPYIVKNQCDGAHFYVD